MPREENPDEPVTRREFNEALQMISAAFERTATKDELYSVRDELRAEFRTEIGDLRSEIREFKSDIRSEMSDIRSEIREFKDEIINEFKAFAETLHHDLAGANKDEVSALKDTDAQQEARINRIEKHLEIA